MKLEILSEKELATIAGAGKKMSEFLKGFEAGIKSGPKGMIEGVKNIHHKKNVRILNGSIIIAYSPELESGRITGSAAVTAGACAAVCGLAYGSYKLGKYVYNKISK